ncbi:hypothetical protein N7U66_03425 [Lacinutrix neustonica]|uniref:Uncharacterized protein n=1 Tax=Lacinutrix neustonica TaxID=2980107 RepID=A0A9E8SHI8_9FLAO|nr:hypothetical protein [Lacinutrix neustonica]WAC02735.1 hypothetical protein N7U66_03425 [Lacinutrix neustonica]
MRFEYRITDFANIGNLNTVFDVEETLTLIKTVSQEEEDENDLQYTYPTGKVESPKVGINKNFGPND